jgi:hypothetical protein
MVIMILGPDTTLITKILIQLARAHFPGVARYPPPKELFSLLADMDKEGCNHGLLVRTKIA